ncbi:MAG: hypothetical protein ACRDD7_09990 [Peptostreptococcaceae bacterium]
MGTKGKLDNGIKFAYTTYVLLQLYNLNLAAKLGLFGYDNFIYKISHNYEITSVGISNAIFFASFFLLNFYIAYSEINELHIFEDEKIKSIIRRRTIINKLLVLFTIILGAYLSIVSKNINIIFTNIYLIINSILILYIKDGYLKSYLYNRYDKWVKSMYNDSVEEEISYIDTKKWRKKIWFTKREKIKFSDRIGFIVGDMITILSYSIFIIYGGLLFKILMTYMAIKPISVVIDNIFNLNSTIDGVCTDVIERSTRYSNYYEIIVTDYKNKREISVDLPELYYANLRDRVEIVHGTFSKKCFTINRVNLNKNKNYGFTLVVLIVMGSLIFRNLYEKKLWEESNINNENQQVILENYEKDNVNEDPRERYTNTSEVLEFYESVDRSKLNYDIKENDKYFVETNFNTIESYDGLIDNQIANNKKYGEILYEYTFGAFENSVSFGREHFLELILNVLPDDAKEVRKVANKEQGKEFIEYSSKEGTFVVSLDKSGYFEGDEFKYYFDYIVKVRFLKLM